MWRPTSCLMGAAYICWCGPTARVTGAWITVMPESVAHWRWATTHQSRWRPRGNKETRRKEASHPVLIQVPNASRKNCKLRLGPATHSELLLTNGWRSRSAKGRAVPTLNKTRWLLGFAYSVIGDRPIAEITAPELLAVLRKVEARGRYETARRLRSTCGQVFRYAIATGRAERDPSGDLRGALTAPKVKHRVAVIEPRSIGAMLRAIDGFDGQATTVAALKLAAILFVRPGELRNAEWTEFDLDAAEWKIPAAKTKMRRVHRVPLSRQALTILRDLRSITGSGRFLFPSVGSVQRPMSENTLNARFAAPWLHQG